MADRSALRLAATLVLIGLLLAVVAQFVHTTIDGSVSSINNHPAEFLVIAASDNWTAVALAQFVATAFIAAGLLAVSFALNLTAGIPMVVNRLGAVAAVVSVALAGVAYAVAGVGLKQAVDAWVQAPVAEQAATLCQCGNPGLAAVGDYELSDLQLRSRAGAGRHRHRVDGAHHAADWRHHGIARDHLPRGGVGRGHRGPRPIRTPRRRLLPGQCLVVYLDGLVAHRRLVDEEVGPSRKRLSHPSSHSSSPLPTRWPSTRRSTRGAMWSSAVSMGSSSMVCCPGLVQ